MEFDLKKALKKHNRRRSIRTWLAYLIVPPALVYPWLYNLPRTESLLWMFGGIAVAFFIHLEVRLKTMQIRLATMADELVELRGKEPEGNLLLELNDW